jgi:hypothetical protein
MQKLMWLFLGVIRLCDGTEFMTWNTMLEGMRHGRPGPYAVYLGTPDNRLPQLLRAGAITTGTIPVIMIAANDQVQNPMTNQMITGATEIQDRHGLQS